MSRGNITRRGKKSWQLKFDVGLDAKGKRRIRYVTVRGTRQDAQKELTRLLAQHDAGTLVEPSKITVEEYLVAWLGKTPPKGEAPPPPPPGITPKTAERYRQLAEQQIYPHLGNIVLQKLKPARVAEWLETIQASGGKKGRPLAARTVGHAKRVLNRALQRAMERETLSRNVAAVIKPPKVDEGEVQILTPDEIALVLKGLEGHELAPMVDLDLATGLRRGELLALTWPNLDLEACTVRVERAVEETKAGLRIKAPKSGHGRRKLSFPASTAAVLREHRKAQLEQRVALGLGKLPADALVFPDPASGSLIKPSWLSYTWRNTRDRLKLPKVTFHAFRHTHASALIAAGLDVVAISRRLGHSSPVVTLRIYAHLFKRDDTDAVAAIEAVMRTQGQQAKR
jgi:integrase